MRPKRYGVLLPATVTFIVYLVYYSVSTLYGYDTAARALMGARWVSHPFFICVSNEISWVFGPLQCYLNGLSTLVCGDPNIGARVVSVITGASTVFPLYGLARKLHGEEAAFYSCLVFPFFTIFTRLSVSGNSEPLSGLLLIMGCYCAVQFISDQRYTWAILAGLSLNLASSARYEIWWFIPTIAIFLLWHPATRPKTNGLRAAALFTTIAMIFPIAWMTAHYFWRGSPFAFIVSEADQFVTLSSSPIGSTLYMFAFLPGVLLLSLSPVVLWVSVYGLVRHVRRDIYALPYWILLTYLVYFLVTFVLTRSVVLVARHVNLPGLMLLVSFGSGLVALRQSTSHRMFSLVRALAFAVLVLMNVLLVPFNKPTVGISESLRALSPVVQDPAYYDSAVEVLTQEARAGARILVDAMDYNQKTLYLRLFDSWSSVHPYYGKPSGFEDEVARVAPDVVVMSPLNRRLQSVLAIDSDTLFIYKSGTRYCCVQKIGILKIFKPCT